MAENSLEVARASHPLESVPHPLTSVTLADVSPDILMKSGPIVTYLQNLESSPLCYKVVPIRSIVTG